MLTIPRDTYLALVGMKSSTLDQRVRVGEAAFAFGVTERPTYGEYFYIDAFAMILASMINCFTGLELKRTVSALRKQWDEYLTVLVKTEHSPGEQQFCCIAWTSLDRRVDPRVIFGDSAEIGAKLPEVEGIVPTFIPISLPLNALKANALKANAKRANIELPAKLTADPKDEPAYAEWRREIRDYQQRAGMRIAKPRPVTA